MTAPGASAERPRLRCAMVGVGAGFTFIDDWARMAQRFADVVGLTPVAELPVAADRKGRRLAVGVHEGMVVVYTTLPTWRPKRIFWRINRRRQAAALQRAAERLEAEVGRIDLLHSHFYAVAGGVPAVAETLGVPFVHTEHTSQLIDPEQPVSRAGRAAMADVFSRAAKVFFVGPHQLEAARRMGLEGDFAVVANPVDPGEFSAPDRDPDGASRLISVGKLRRLKRHDLTLRALAMLSADRPDVTLEIVGEGPLAGELAALASQLGVADRVTFAGRVSRSEVASRLARASVYVHAADRETFGVALVEALLSGLPVVARQAGGVASELPPGTGVAVAGSDPAALATAIEQVLEGGFDRAHIRRVARDRFGVDGVAAAVERAYGEAVWGG